ncbi:MAG: tyrosine-type recombinase/integrase [Candidatus Dormibacteraeota bacterium]|nr:tyrosine-type recombinase/integrase [Candidatus Dormibacteraeota bacterium]
MPTTRDQRQLTVGLWVERWWTIEGAHPRRWRPSTEARARTLLHGADEAMPEFFRLRLAEVAPAHVSTLLARVMERKKWSARTARHLRSVVRTALNDALAAGVMRQANPAGQGTVLLPPLKQQQLAILEGEAREAFLKECLRTERRTPVHPLGDLFALSLLLGWRPGEARALRWSSVNPRAKTVTIERTVTLAKPGAKRRLGTGPTKSAASKRTLLVSDQAMRIFVPRARRHGISEKQLDMWANDVSSLGGEPLVETLGETWVVEPLVWPSEQHPRAPVEHTVVQKALERVLNSAPGSSLDRWRCADMRSPGATQAVRNRAARQRFEGEECERCATTHLRLTPVMLRHSAVSWWIANGISTVSAAKRAGHSSVEMVQRVYGHGSESEARRITALDAKEL